MAKATSPRKTTNKTVYRECMVEVKGPATNRSVEEVKFVREVLLPEAMAETINEGVLNMDTVNNNRLPLYYFPLIVKEEGDL